MLESYEIFYRQLSRATLTVLFITLASFGMTLVCALLGLSHAVVSLNGVTLVLASVFGGMLGVFLLTTLIWALVRFLNRRSSPSS